MRIMGNVIEVYVKSMRIPVGADVTYDLPGHQCAKPHAIAVFEKALVETDRSVLDLCKAIAEEKALKIKVHDVSTMAGKLMAQVNSVKTTPTVIIENKKIEGTITKERLLATI